MSTLIRAARALFLAVPLLLAAAPPADAKAREEGPWLYRGSDVPQDKEWVFGELSNGLRYAVRRNGVPPGQVTIRIRMDVGSLYEADSERGFAHLIEHLVFRQSKYLGEAQAIPTWQRLGATFGNDTNAETTPTQTVYKLDLPNATPKGLEESFKLLSGMMIAPTLSEANVRTEVPIVLAERRERGGAVARLQEAMQTTLYAGQPLAERLPIGTEATLEAANQDAVRAFHTRWYRPENAMIAVAGDADPKDLERLVRKWFGRWKGRGKPQAAPDFGTPQPPVGQPPAGTTAVAAGANPVGDVKVLVEPDLPRAVTYATLRPWIQVTDNIAYNQGLMIESLAQQLINRRLEAKARAGGSYLMAQVRKDDVSRSVDGTFVSVTPLGEDWHSAVRDVRAVLADAMAHPPTEAEIERETAEMDIAFQVPVEQKRLLTGTKVADDLVTAVDIREAVAAPDDVLDIFRKSIPLFTPANVLEKTRALFSGVVTRAIMVTPRAGEADEAGLRRALSEPVVADGGARLAFAPVRFDEMPPIGKPSAPQAVAPTGILDIEQADFANGVKVLLWPSKDEPGRLTVKVRFGGGYRVFQPGDAPYIALGEMALVGSGVGSLGQEELDRISTGRKMGFDFSIEDTSFEFSAETRPADLADQLYLFAAKFATPRWDANPVTRAKAALRMQYEAFSTSPQGMIERELRFLQKDRDPRYRTPSPAEIAAATQDGFRSVWKRALNAGPIEVQLFGDFDRDSALQALSRSFGALAKRAPLPDDAAPATARFPAATTSPVMLTHRGAADQAAAIVSWPTGGGMAGVRESRQLEILSQLFSNRLLDAMREKLGASYAPQVVSQWPVDLANGGAISAMAQLQPSAVPVFFTTVRDIAADLIARPASDDELARVIEPLRQQITRAATGSAFFMYQLEGATTEPAKFDALRTLLYDYTHATPGAMQVLASRYLGPDRKWELAVMPQGQTANGAGPSAPGAGPPAGGAQPAK